MRITSSNLIKTSPFSTKHVRKMSFFLINQGSNVRLRVPLHRVKHRSHNYLSRILLWYKRRCKRVKSAIIKFHRGVKSWINMIHGVLLLQLRITLLIVGETHGRLTISSWSLILMFLDLFTDTT